MKKHDKPIKILERWIIEHLKKETKRPRYERGLLCLRLAMGKSASKEILCL